MRLLALLGLLAITVGAGYAATPDAAQSAVPPPLWLRVIGTFLGSLLVIYGLFTVPGDHKRYENYLVRWWVWVEEKRDRGIRWQAALLQVATNVASRAFDRVFGSRMVSPEATGAAAALFMSTLVTLLAVLLLVTPKDRVPDPGFSPPLVSAFLVCFAVAFLLIGLIQVLRPQFVRYQLPLAALVFVFMFGAVFVISHGLGQNPSWMVVAELMSQYLVALVASISINALFISITRRLLKLGLHSSAVVIWTLILLNVVLAVVVSIVPMLLIRASFMSPMLQDILFLIAVFSALDTAVALVALLITSLMLLHRVAWPAISRLLQVVNDEHVLLKRWPLFFAGVGILCVTWPGLGLVAKIFGLKA